MWGYKARPQVDYLADPRLALVPFVKLKRFVQDNGAKRQDLFYASTKFALVALAEKARHAAGAPGGTPVPCMIIVAC